MKITGHVKLFSLDHVRAVLTQRHAQKKQPCLLEIIFVNHYGFTFLNHVLLNNIITAWIMLGQSVH